MADDIKSNCGASTRKILTTTLVAEYAVYDGLPPCIRAALQESPEKFGADQIPPMLADARAAGWTDQMVADWIRRQGKKISREAEVTHYGPDFPPPRR